MADDRGGAAWWVVCPKGFKAKLTRCRTLDGAVQLVEMLRSCGVSTALILSSASLITIEVEDWCQINNLVPVVVERKQAREEK